MSTPLDYFGLRPDADEREIKRAYAKKLKSIRPDQDPAGFQQLHAMYQQALAWVRRGAAHPVAPGTPVRRHASATAAPAAQTAAQSLQAATQTTTSEARREPFDPSAFLHGLLPRLAGNDPAQLLAWLNEQPELWSLENKRIAGQVVLNRLFQDPQPVASANFDALLQCFGLDQIDSGIDPIRQRWLRAEMDEQHWAMQRARGIASLSKPGDASPDGRLASPWGQGEEQADPDRFFDWFCARAPGIKEEDLAMYVRVGLVLLPRNAKSGFARRVIECLLRDAPPLPAYCTRLALKLLLPYAGNLVAQPGLRDLAARLQIKWLTQAGNTAALQAHTRPRQGSERSQANTRRLLRCAQRPFNWFRMLLASLLPLWPQAMGTFLRQLSGNQVSRLHEVFDPRTVDYWIDASERQRIALPRVAVGAIRCALLLLCGIAIGLLRKLAPDSPLSGPQSWDLLALAAIASGAYLAYLAYLRASFWQRGAETPAVPYALLRCLFIPAMVALGLAIYFASGNRVAAQIVLAPLNLLAFQRYQSRSKSPLRLNGVNRLVRLLLFYLGLGLLAQILIAPPLSAGCAFVLWIIDASQRENRPSFSRQSAQPHRASRSR